MNKLAVLALTTVSLLLAACNTVKGAGKDIESVGNEGEKVINQ
ncbi:entericidin A/B family lipoprotein [Sphingobium sp. DEHP117]|nr:entericidin A/B family lipoprotein [Sphingobium sp. DEHP117]MDQ4420566.1 entericidin A/B family lipoprotein [Sphingobium sp. DEHP117]